MRLLYRRRARGTSPEPALAAALPCVGSPATSDAGKAPLAAARRRTRGRSPEAAAAALVGAPCLGGPGDLPTPASKGEGDDSAPGAHPASAPQAAGRRRTRGRSPEAAAAALAGAPCLGGPGNSAITVDDGELTPGASVGLAPVPREKRQKALPAVRCVRDRLTPPSQVLLHSFAAAPGYMGNFSCPAY